MGVTISPNQQVDRLFLRLTSQDRAFPESHTCGPLAQEILIRTPSRRLVLCSGLDPKHSKDRDVCRTVADTGEGWAGTGMQ